ncbi:AcrR family transcriptional regulator [Catenulispora sp. EB89]|uniref:TetR family transcriptional regulator n=1 Tax=Catenulispora sp. EB89 TaxID=3156257 RepID=UPI003516E3A9
MPPQAGAQTGAQTGADATDPGGDSTRDRIVAAATAEFAQHGIAGARIERIAKAAKTSKERVYAHFRSKEALYRYVADRELAAVAEAARMDPADLPEYAGRIHDYFVRHPDRHRLMDWGRLEFPGTPDLDSPMHKTIRFKVEQLRRAQEAGQLDPAWEPLDILIFVHQIATAWAGQLGLASAEAGLVREPSPAARRAAIIAAVQRMFPAAEV